MSSLKHEISSSDFEGDHHELQTHPNIRLANAVHSIRVTGTILALLAGIVTLSLSADTLAVYNTTHLPPDYLLPLWPENFDLRPTHALVAGGGIVTAMNALSLFASNTQSVRWLSHQAGNTPIGNHQTNCPILGYRSDADPWFTPQSV